MLGDSESTYQVLETPCKRSNNDMWKPKKQRSKMHI